MGVAPRLGVPVYHHTDHVLRADGHRLYRRLPPRNFKNLGGFNECLLQQKLPKNMPKTSEYYAAVQKQ